jgi:hypothetical protein
MFGLVTSLLRNARYLKRIAISMDSLVRLYKLDLESRGIYDVQVDPNFKPGKDDMTEISYESQDPELDSVD